MVKQLYQRFSWLKFIVPAATLAFLFAFCISIFLPKTTSPWCEGSGRLFVSFDGKDAAVVRPSERGAEIVRLSTSGSGKQRLWLNGKIIRDFAVSSRGVSFVSYAENCDGPYRLAKLAADSNSLVDLGVPIQSVGAFCISPDGATLLCVGYRHFHSALLGSSEAAPLLLTLDLKSLSCNRIPVEGANWMGKPSWDHSGASIWIRASSRQSNTLLKIPISHNARAVEEFNLAPELTDISEVQANGIVTACLATTEGEYSRKLIALTPTGGVPASLSTEDFDDIAEDGVSGRIFALSAGAKSIRIFSKGSSDWEMTTLELPVSNALPTRRITGGKASHSQRHFENKEQ